MVFDVPIVANVQISVKVAINKIKNKDILLFISELQHHYKILCNYPVVAKNLILCTAAPNRSESRKWLYA